MPGKIGFRVHPPWRRPEPALLAAFGEASPAQAADAMCRLGAMDSGIRPIWPSPRIVGAALTVWLHSGDNLMLHKAIAMAQPGDIIVVNTQGNVVNACFGGIMALSAVKAKVAALIVDGLVRDADEIEALRLPVYARGLNPNSCWKDGAGEVGGVIACGGVAVRAGDVVLADRDGVMVVPLADAAEVARLANAQVAGEKQRVAEIERGVITRPEIDEQLRRRKVIE